MPSKQTPTTFSPFKAFRDLPASSISLLEKLAEEKTYQSGDLIVRSGDSADRLFLLRQGLAYATVPGSDGVWFNDYMKPGDVFGEMALLTGDKRSADVTAQTEVTCLELPFGPLRALFTEQPEVAAVLTSIVGARLTGRSGIREVGGFEIEGPLGGGGFARVFCGKNPNTGEQVAIKMLRHELVWRKEYAKRFRREARAIQRIVHPSVVRVHGVVDAYATIFIVMELVLGGDLVTCLVRNGPLSASEVRYVFHRIALALHSAHEKDIIHRDVKPANILLTRDGDLKLADFGVALTPGEARTTAGKTGTFTGTPHYAAPEHVLGRDMDGRTDLFMLGVTAFELLQGHTPHNRESAVSVLLKHVAEDMPDPRENPSIPGDLAEAIYRSTRRLPQDRFSSCKEAADWLEAQGGKMKPPQITRRARVGEGPTLPPSMRRRLPRRSSS